MDRLSTFSYDMLNDSEKNGRALPYWVCIPDLLWSSIILLSTVHCLWTFPRSELCRVDQLVCKVGKLRVRFEHISKQRTWTFLGRWMSWPVNEAIINMDWLSFEIPRVYEMDRVSLQQSIGKYIRHQVGISQNRGSVGSILWWKNVQTGHHNFEACMHACMPCRSHGHAEQNPASDCSRVRTCISCVQVSTFWSRFLCFVIGDSFILVVVLGFAWGDVGGWATSLLSSSSFPFRVFPGIFEAFGDPFFFGVTAFRRVLLPGAFASGFFLVFSLSFLSSSFVGPSISSSSITSTSCFFRSSPPHLQKHVLWLASFPFDCPSFSWACLFPFHRHSRSSQLQSQGPNSWLLNL